MPNIVLSESESVFFGMLSEPNAAPKKNKSKPGKLMVRPFYVCLLLTVAGAAIGSHYYNKNEVAIITKEKAAALAKSQELQSKVGSLQEELEKEKEKSKSIPAPDFPPSPAFQAQQPLSVNPTPPAIVVQTEPQPIKKPAPVQKKAPEQAKPPAVVAPLVALTQPLPVEQKKPETSAAPKFLPVLMLPANKTHIQLIEDAGITWRYDNGARKSIKIGEALPNGDVLAGVDPSTQTVWTDKQIISIIKE